jgi:pimeloyl-ACP methyl ester carboxylesterase
MEWYFILAIVLVSLLLIAFAVARWTYNKAFYSPKKRKEDIYDIPKGEQYEERKDFMFSLITDMSKIPFEWVETTSYDGLKLRGRYYHVRDDAPLQIEFHGYRGTAYRDFCGGHKLAREAGFNTLVVDQRAHGESEGTCINFGVKEKYDCISWINYALARFGKDKEIHLSGVSMGASTVLMACGLGLPKNVKSVIADSPFSSPSEIIEKVCGDMGYPPKLAMPFVKLGAKVFGNLSLQGSAVEAVKNATVPILIIHGEADKFVPCEMSRKIFEANPDKITLATFEGAGHGLSYIKHHEQYNDTVRTFLERVTHA